jgi:RNA recognition motif-containing protein
LITPKSFLHRAKIHRNDPERAHWALGLKCDASGIIRSDVMGRKLFVGNLSFSVGETELKQLFEQKGGVESVTVMRDLDTGRSRGFGFVEMSTDEAAQKAITELNAFAVDGRNLTVNEARPKPERRGGGGGGGRGGGRHREPRW